jgi:hypothetical protein
MTKHGLKDATIDKKVIADWWGKSPSANVGIITGSESGLVVVDVDPRSGGLESLKSISKLGNFPVTPGVYTGGGGEHIYLAHPSNGTKIKCAQALAGYPGIDLKGDGGYVIAPPSKHVSGGKYTWKIHHLKNKLAAIPTWLHELMERPAAPMRALANPLGFAFMPLDKNNCFSSRGGGNDVTLCIPEGHRDATLFNLARALRKGGMPKDEIAQCLVMIAQNCCNPPMAERDAIAKVESTFRAERCLGDEIREWIALQKGYFTVTECDSELQVVTPQEKSLRRVTIHRLVEANKLERIENRTGTYRVVADNLEYIDLLEEGIDEPLDLKWPFGLENLVDIMPKNIIIVAGTKDAGKSAFCLNTVLLNQHKWDMRYFSSEMGAHELKRRLRKFEGMNISDWKFKPYLRHSRFADVIFPEAFNIIDYLEISKDFSIIAEEIRQIYDKLTTGIALIAIQKDPDKPLGRGSSFSIEKARMYLTLDRTQFHNICTIVSGKNWHQEGFNPTSVPPIKYKLFNGARISEIPA